MVFKTDIFGLILRLRQDIGQRHALMRLINGITLQQMLLLLKTTNRNSSQLDFYTYNNASDGIHGYAVHRISSSMTAAPEIQNWKSGEVCLNRGKLQGSTADFDSGIAAHEMCLVFGLEHNGASTAILMHSYDDIRTATSPKQDDINGVNAIYR